jgi:hypothetical protein
VIFAELCFIVLYQNNLHINLCTSIEIILLLALSPKTLSETKSPIYGKVINPDQKYFRSSVTRPDGLDLANKPSQSTKEVTEHAT